MELVEEHLTWKQSVLLSRCWMWPSDWSCSQKCLGIGLFLQAIFSIIIITCHYGRHFWMGKFEMFSVLAVSLVSCSILKQGAWSLDVMQSHPLCRTCLANIRPCWADQEMGTVSHARNTVGWLAWDIRVFSHKGGRQLWKSCWWNIIPLREAAKLQLKNTESRLLLGMRWWKFSWSLSHLKSEKYS